LERRKASVILFFGGRREKTGGKLAALGVIGDAGTAFPVLGAGVGAGAFYGFVGFARHTVASLLLQIVN
jgi:hypothetical protein